MSEERHAGLLKFLHRTRGFGFAIRNDGTQDFLHIRSLRDSGVDLDCLVDGETRLSYRMIEDTRNSKYKAIDIRIEE
jgi:cold shock CspA family protein